MSLSVSDGHVPGSAGLSMGATTSREGVRSWVGRWIAAYLYGSSSPTVRCWLRRLVMRLERGGVYSWSIREIFRRYHKVTVGLYTIGPCESDPDHFAPGTVIGRYCSIYYTARVLASDGPTSVWFDGGPAWDPYSSRLDATTQGREGLTIGHDVYVGHHAVILPSVRSIGHGAVVGAGSVVHQDVPPYAVVTGNPARVVRYRFRSSTIEKLLAEQWWLNSIEEIVASGRILNQPLEEPVSGLGQSS